MNINFNQFSKECEVLSLAIDELLDGQHPAVVGNVLETLLACTVSRVNDPKLAAQTVAQRFPARVAYFMDKSHMTLN